MSEKTTTFKKFLTVAAAALCLCALPVQTASGLTLSPPIKGIGSLYANGDGNLISYQWVSDGWSISIFSPRLMLNKQFKVCPYGDPTKEQLTTLVINREGKYYTSYLASQNVVNSDDKWEVAFYNAQTGTVNIYNEDNVFLGTLSHRNILETENGQQYWGGESTVEETNDQTYLWKDIILNNGVDHFKDVMTTADYHFDFGLPAVNLALDSKALDVLGNTSGYNWFREFSQYKYNQPNHVGNVLIYNTFTNMIDRMNSVIGGYNGQTLTPESKFYLAQAYGLRAYCYHSMAQLYQFTYAGNEDKPCVPLIDEKNYNTLRTVGIPRATVKDTYAFILSDYNRAIELMDGAISCAEARPDEPRTMMSEAVLHGLRARAYLVMQHYAEAKADALKAIELFDGEPYSINDIARPQFVSINEPAWMWGLHYKDTDRAVISGIVNFQSHMSSFPSNGYTGVGAGRYAPHNFVLNFTKNNETGDTPQMLTDRRAAWFLIAYGVDMFLTDAQKEILENKKESMSYGGAPDFRTDYILLNTKFGTADERYNEAKGDYPLMRIEEMHYIVAEAEAMGGNMSDAITYLTNFVKKYRNPDYTVAATITTPEGLRDEIWMQRRIEFWGEGLSFYDLMRLKKGVDRLDVDGWDWYSEARFKIESDDPALLLPFPQQVINNNAALTDADNNPVFEVPVNIPK